MSPLLSQKVLRGRRGDFRSGRLGIPLPSSLGYPPLILQGSPLNTNIRGILWRNIRGYPGADA